jgi:general secretion pathway protein A
LYEPWYGFREKPFSLTPDPKYLYLSPRHAEAFAHLEFGRRERGGFIVITGDVGTGKTTLARYFLSKLGPDTRTAVVLYPALTAAELLRSILDDLHVTPAGDSLKALVDALHRFLLESRAASRNVVLLIDEAQDLSAEVLEQVRLLSNLETDTEKLIQIILMGQSELRDMLARHELRQLAQRVTARYHLAPLDATETGAYVRHRITVAGGSGKAGFTSDALAAVHARTRGVPRLINLVCDRALLAGYVKGSRTITAAMVGRASDEVEAPALRRPVRWRHGLVGSVLTLVLALSAFALAPRLARAPAVPPPPVSLGGGAGATTAAAGAAIDGIAPAAAAERPGAAGTPLSPSPTPRPPSPPPSSSALDAFLRTADSRASLAQATARISRAWGGASLARTTLRAPLDQIRALDLPAVLEMFHPSRTDTCYLALVGLGKLDAVVSFGSGRDETVPLAQIEAYWMRNAIVAWPEDPALGRYGPRLDAWARERLMAHGYDAVDLPEAVRRFQADAGLVSDGLLGPRTRMALYARSSPDHPRLRTEAAP